VTSRLVPALAIVVGVLVWAGQTPATSRTFAADIAALSEPGGYFDTDNLISNERSYLHVVPALRALSQQRGAYLGVGPDQNFSYIAHLRPSIAIVIDIRRDNLLLQLLFKALFEMAPTRAAYLGLLTGRAPPGPARATGDLESIVRHVDRTPALAPAERSGLQARIAGVIDRFGLPLSAADHRTIAGLHSRFIDAGLGLQFNSSGRPPQYNYPTYRDLLLETDRAGVRRSFLATDEAFAFVKALQARDLVIPVVGDLAGSKAVAAVGNFLAARGERVSAFYVSNVEFYLFRQGSFARFVANLERLPRAPDGLIVRSVFSGAHIEPGYNSASVTQPMADLVSGFAAGRFRQYGEIIAASR